MLSIKVCWEPGINYTTEKNWVRQAVKKSIEENSEYRFPEMWDECNNAAGAHIRISVMDLLPQTQVGYQYYFNTDRIEIPKATNMRLNFVFHN